MHSHSKRENRVLSRDKEKVWGHLIFLSGQRHTPTPNTRTDAPTCTQKRKIPSSTWTLKKEAERLRSRTKIGVMTNWHRESFEELRYMRTHVVLEERRSAIEEWCRAEKRHDCWSEAKKMISMLFWDQAGLQWQQIRGVLAVYKRTDQDWQVELLKQMGCRMHMQDSTSTSEKHQMQAEQFGRIALGSEWKLQWHNRILRISWELLAGREKPQATV